MRPDTLMSQADAQRRPAIAVVVRTLLAFDTIALVFAAALHVQGIHITLGSAVFDEPQIVPAGIVESIAGLLFVWATYTVFTAKSSAWTSTLAAHLFAIAGFLVGIVATWSGTAPFNALYHALYHRVMLAVFVAGLILAPLPAGRAALRSTRR
jgi:hypothetical protein